MYTLYTLAFLIVPFRGWLHKVENVAYPNQFRPRLRPGPQWGAYSAPADPSMVERGLAAQEPDPASALQASLPPPLNTYENKSYSYALANKVYVTNSTSTVALPVKAKFHYAS